MTATHGVGTYGNAVGTVTPLDHKMAQLGLVVKTATNTIRAGLFWDGSATIVSGKANMSYDVRALTAVTSRGATAGAVLLSNDAVYNVVTTAAPGSNSRYDVVYIWQREYSIDGTNSDPVIGVTQGTAAASPTVPSLASFPGAIELARILVPSGVTATNSGTTITQTAPFTALAGGTVMVRNATERDAGSWVEGQTIQLLDTDVLQRFHSSAWQASGGATPIFQVGRGSAQAIGAATYTLVAAGFGTPGLNIGFTSFASGLLTIATTGWYRITVAVNWPATATQVVHEVTVNSTAQATAATVQRAYGASSLTTAASSLVFLTAADVLRLYVYTTGAQNLGSFPRDLQYSVEWVRAA